MTDKCLGKVQMFVSCRKLKDMDLLSKSDPFVEIYEKTHDSVN